MATFANTLAAPATDGIPYATQMVVPAAEGSLFNQTPPGLTDPVQVLYGQAALASVKLTAQGAILSQTTYIVMQTSLSDGNWLDVAWCTWTGISGTILFALSSSGVGSANAFQQRVTGVAPSPTLGSNPMCLGGKVRFVGKSTVGVTSSSSSARSVSSAGPAVVTPAVLADITMKLLGLS